MEANAPAPSEGKDLQVGPYRLLNKIGQGGMGEVFVAVREGDLVRRRVALKVVRRGLDDETIRRFEIEKQILTVLNHPNIARLFDTGVSEDGRAYIAMELIDGQAIDEYCNAQKLSVNERLALFRQVCSAVTYAHANLVVHRDLKPANILVTSSGQVKLLDFGIAKLLNPDWLSMPHSTGPELTIMTPEYASPEQARREPITVASDVYSLGVILYELLTGSRPYDFKSRLQEEIRRVICEEPPERPSTRITKVETVRSRRTQAETTLNLAKRAQDRSSTPEGYRRLLRGDLESMVLHALKKEPSRRYASVEEFSRDVSAWLEGKPLAAVGDAHGIAKGLLEKSCNTQEPDPPRFELKARLELLHCKLSMGGHPDTLQELQLAVRDLNALLSRFVADPTFLELAPKAYELLGIAHLADGDRVASDNAFSEAQRRLKELLAREGGSDVVYERDLNRIAAELRGERR